MSEGMPSNDWSLKKIAEYCVSSIRRSGEDAWKIGKGFSIARSRHKQDRDWLRWLREEVEGLGKSTAYRYIEVFNKFTLNQVRSLSLNEIYDLIQEEKETAKPKADVQDSDDDNQDGDGRADDGAADDEAEDASESGAKAKAKDTVKPSWAVDENDLFKVVTSAITELKECLALANWETLDETQRVTISVETAELKALLDDVDQKLAVE